MKPKAGLCWDTPTPFHRYIEESGVLCEHITPQMLAAPFYRGRLMTFVVPTGFAHPAYSGLLPALRVSSDRIKRFVNKGGNILIFGAMASDERAYDWLPFDLTYTHEYFSASVQARKESPLTAITEDFDGSNLDCDGHLSSGEAIPLISTEDGKVLMLSYRHGEGTYLVTSIHEYPSRKFLLEFCTSDKETIF